MFFHLILILIGLSRNLTVRSKVMPYYSNLMTVSFAKSRLALIRFRHKKSQALTAT